MNMNNIFANGSTVDVLLYCPISMDIGEMHFDAGEPFTLLKSVSVNIQSNAVTPTAAIGGELKLINQHDFIYSLRLNAVTMTSKLQNLFFQPKTGIKNTDFINKISHSTIKLDHLPQAFFLYKDGVKSDDGSIEEIDDNIWFTIANFDDTANYQLFYSWEDNRCLRFIDAQWPYFGAILYGVSNTNGQPSKFRMFFDKLSLMPATSFDFSRGSNNTLNLSFGVIDADNTVSILFE